MLAAAAESAWDCHTALWRAAERRGVERQAARSPAGRGEHLLKVGAQVRFRHPVWSIAGVIAAGELD